MIIFADFTHPIFNIRVPKTLKKTLIAFTTFAFRKAINNYKINVVHLTGTV